jgi:hypothetical protein
MTSKVRVSAVALSLGLVISLPAVAGNEGSASGGFSFSAGGPTNKIELNVKIDKDGRTKGQMSYSGPVDVPDQDVDGTGDAIPGGSLPDFSMNAEFDCLVVSGNRAVMSGVVTDASVKQYIGRRALLAVEDNGEGINAPAPDRLTWGLYELARQTWVPVDAEVKDDFGASLSWIATDAEREDDKGVPSRRSDDINCRSFPLETYTFIDLEHGSGNIQVRP